MFLGEFQHSIDDKGRIKLPSKLKDPFEGEAVIMERSDGSLALYPLDTFEKEIAQRAEEMDELDPQESDWAEDLGSRSASVSMDKGGRILIPPRMRENAEIDSDVYIIGSFSHLTIRSAESWEVKRKENKETRHIRARKMAKKK